MQNNEAQPGDEIALNIATLHDTKSVNMKRLTTRYAKWLRYRQRRVAKRRRGKSAYVEMVSSTGIWRAKAPKAASMPKVLSFDSNVDETLSALADIRRRVNMPMTGERGGIKISKHRNARPKWMNSYTKFETIEAISPAVALVLASEYARSFHFHGISARVIDAHKWHPEVLATLWDIGFFDIVGLPQHLEKPDLKESFAILPMRSGHTADSAKVTDLISDLKDLYPGDLAAPADKMVHLYGAMVEGIVNVVRHAYPPDGEFQYRPTGLWWMTGAVDRSRRWATAVIYDQGITIPVSLPDWDRYSGFKRRIMARIGLVPAPHDPKSDGDAIAAAVEESVSSTGDPHRGHGLAQMRDFVDQCSEGYLRIMSRHGEVIFRENGQRDVRTHKLSIGGTLIEWRALL